MGVDVWQGGPSVLYLAQLSQGSSRDSMAASLRSMEALARELAGRAEGPVDWAALDWAQASALRTAARQRWAPSTANRHLAAVRGVVRTAGLMGLVDPARVERCRHGLRNVPASHHGADPTARLVTSGELLAMFTALAAEPSPRARRDAAMLAVLAMGGLRRSEVVGVDLADVDVAAGTLLVRHGKGGFVRKVWLHGGALAAVVDWLAVRGGDDGPLLCHVRRGGSLVAGEQGRLSDHTVWKRLRAVAAQAGVAELAPHDLRRKMVSDLLDAGVDLSAAKVLAGHADVSTTARYDRRGEHAAHRASLHLHVPYIPPPPNRP